LLLVRAKDEQLATLAKVHRGMAQTIADGHVLSCHDVSDWRMARRRGGNEHRVGIGLKLDASASISMSARAVYLVEVRAQGVESFHGFFCSTDSWATANTRRQRATAADF